MSTGVHISKYSKNYLILLESHLKPQNSILKHLFLVQNDDFVDQDAYFFIKIKYNVYYQDNIYYFRVLSCKNHFLVKIYVGLFIHTHFPRTELQ